MGRNAASIAATIVAGLAHAASMGSPWNGQPVWWLQLLALGGLAWQLDRCTLSPSSPRQAARLGWLFATAWLCGTFWWLFVAMHTYAGLPALLAALAIVALAGVLALYYGAACALFVRVAPVNRAWAAIVFAALWMLAEMARGIWFTGFGWGAAGYAHIDGLAVFAKYVGAYGVGALAACVAYLLASGLRAPWAWRSLGITALTGVLTLVVVLVPGLTRHEFSTAGTTLRVALLQGNIAQDEKFQPGTGIADALRWYGEQMGVNHAALIVAPETAIPILPQQLPEGYWDALTRPFVSNPADPSRPTDPASQQALLMGIPLGSYSQGYTNSVVGIKGIKPTQGTIDAAYRYDKHHLVPFGEFIPPLFKWFTQMMNIPLGDFNRGAVGQPSFEWQGQRLAPNVCYEDLFGEELGARFVDPATAPTIFVNVSNIGWFGNTIAIDQHLNISRMRALEFERPFIRATNTGDTVIIDHTGRVTHALPRHTRGVLLGQVQGRQGRQGTAAGALSGNGNEGGITPFAWWVSRFGLWPLWLAGAGIVLLAAWGRARRHT
jgi:apolipoprotein N-acyltransferase